MLSRVHAIRNPAHVRQLLGLGRCFSLVLIVAVVSTLTGCNIPRFSAERIESIDVPYKTNAKLVVESFNGSITIGGGDVDSIIGTATITARGATQKEANDNLEKVSMKINQDEKVISLVGHRESKDISGGVAYEISVPTGIPVDLNTSNGSVEVRATNGKVQIKTSNGAVKVFDARDEIIVDTSNGAVQVSDCKGVFDIHSSNGELVLEKSVLTGDCQLDTSNGRIAVGLPVQAPITVNASTSNGKVECFTEAIEVTSPGAKKMSGVLFGSEGQSAKSTLNLSTSNGAIQISESEKSSTDGPESTQEPEVTESAALS